MPTGWRTISSWSTGPRASRRCSATGSAAAPAPKSIFSSAAHARAATASRAAGVQGLARRPRGRRFSAQARRGRAAHLHDAARHALSAPPTWCIAPEHPAVERLTRPANSAEAVRAYCEQAARKSDLDRTDLAKDKTGVFTGSFAVNPVNSRPVPIWVADYVLASYGTGAIMAVPAHDTRDFEFAQQFGLPIVAVVDPTRGYFGRSRESAGRRGGVHRRGHGDQLEPLRRPADRRVQGKDHGRPGRPGRRPRGGQLQAARLAVQPAAFLGRAVSDPARARRRRSARPAASARCRPTSCRSTCPR